MQQQLVGAGCSVSLHYAHTGLVCGRGGKAAPGPGPRAPCLQGPLSPERAHLATAAASPVLTAQPGPTPP